MVFFAIIVSLLLTLLNIYLVIKIWQFNEKITTLDNELINYESDLKTLLPNTRQILKEQQSNIQNAQQKYQNLKLRWQKTRKFLILISWLYRITAKFS